MNAPLGAARLLGKLKGSIKATSASPNTSPQITPNVILDMGLLLLSQQHVAEDGLLPGNQRLHAVLGQINHAA